MDNSPNPANSAEQNAAQPVSMAGIGTHESVLDLIKAYFPKSSRIADLAAGEGAFSVELKRLGHEVVAVDASDANWKVPDIDLRLCDFDREFAETVLNGGGKFDGIVAIEIIEHLENPFQFARECAKLLKPGGIMALTTPNVEAVFSRLLFLYTGRLNTFGLNETVRFAHITPIFKWKLDMLLDEAGFEVLEEFGVPLVLSDEANLKVRLTAFLSGIVSPFVKGEKGREGRIVIARLKQPRI